MDDEKPPLPDPEGEPGQVITVADLVERLQTAGRGKNRKYGREHRILLMNAAFALQQLALRLHQYENKESVN